MLTMDTERLITSSTINWLATRLRRLSTTGTFFFNSNKLSLKFRDKGKRKSRTKKRGKDENSSDATKALFSKDGLLDSTELRDQPQATSELL